MTKGILHPPVSESDALAINRLLGQLSSKAAFRSVDAINAAVSSQSAAPGSRVFIIRDTKGVIVGMASVFVVQTILQRVGHVEDVVVEHFMRGHGLGKALMEEIIAWARIAELDHLDLTSAPHRVAARALYESLGFKRRDTDCYRLGLAGTR